MLNLKLPSKIHFTGAWLKDLAAKHTKIEHLSLSTRCKRITTDACQNPFEGFIHLQSLSLELGSKYKRCPDHNHNDLQSVGATLDHLRIKSLVLSGAYQDVLPDLQIPGHVTTPNLIESLVHLRIDDEVDFEHGEHLLYHCRRLETLHLDVLRYARDASHNILVQEYPPLVVSKRHMSPFLRLITFGFASFKFE